MEQLLTASLTPSTLILAIVAILPAIFLAVYIYKKDRVEKEPASLLIQLFILGGTVSVAVAIGLEVFLDKLLDNSLSFFGLIVISDDVVHCQSTLAYYFYNFLSAFICVALPEEFCKWSVVRLRTWKSKQFNYTFDGVVYCTLTSLGFACVENVSYAFQYGISTALVRAVTAVPGHFFFGVFMGLMFGEAKRKAISSQERTKSFAISSLILPVIIHGIYDYCLFVDTTLSNLIFYGFLILLYLYAFRLVKVAAYRDARVEQQTEVIFDDNINENRFL